MKPLRNLPLDALLLDVENPRLPSSVTRNQRDILTYIARETSIEDLMAPIAINGFFSAEPLVVYEDPTRKGKYRVIEGNRRLTAVMLLNDPDLYPKRAAIREIAETAKFKPTSLPVIEVDTREEVLPYLGSRHITGVKAWDPLAKSRYMEQLFNLTPKKSTPDDRYRLVAKTIGSRRDFIKKNLDSLAVYKIIERADFFDIDDLSEATVKFSVLTTALGYESISAFVGGSKLVGKGKDRHLTSADPIVHPDVLDDDRVEELARWLFEGDEQGDTRLGESRNLGQLAKVVDSKEALALFRRGASLKTAYRETSGLDDELATQLTHCKSLLQEASSIVANASPTSETRSLARDVYQLARSINTVIKDKLESADEDE